MTQLYVPELGDLIRLTEPLVLKAEDMVTPGRLGVSWQATRLLWRINNSAAAWDYKAAENVKVATLELGTVLKFKRYFISSHAKENRVDVSIFAHPDPFLTPRAQGGKGDTIVMELPLKVLNQIHYEKVTL